MKNTLLIIFGTAILLSGCGSQAAFTRTVKFSPKNDEITTTPSLKEFLASNPNPKIVLRAISRGGQDEVTETDNIDYLYNAIEGEMLKSGFIVRDRQLFNKIIGNSDNNNNYENLKEKSDTDLIIELTNLDRSIQHQTNVYYDNKGRERNSNALAQMTYYGATIEFKVIMINTNQFAGIYKFNYVPCVEGCDYPSSIKAVNLALKKSESYEAVEENKLIEFAKTATNQLILEMNN